MSERFPCIAVYIMTNRPFGVLYVGVTNDLPRRAFEHREGLLKGFSLDHGCKMLVWYEIYEMMSESIAREKRQEMAAGLEVPADRADERGLGGPLSDSAPLAALVTPDKPRQRRRSGAGPSGS
jgi:predicted GIY-YIG superfamily endonuclease